MQLCLIRVGHKILKLIPNLYVVDGFI